MDYPTAAFAVGFAGDALLQAIVRTTGFDWGLGVYFNQHGSLEAMTIAGGMMFLAAKGAGLATGGVAGRHALPLFLYGGALDVLFRHMRLFPSLDGYYRALTPAQSFVWGGIPMVLPLLIS